MKTESPSMDAWLKEAKTCASASETGMYLIHNGTVRRTARAKVRDSARHSKDVTGMIFSHDAQKLDAVVKDTYQREGVFYIRVWLNEGRLDVGDDIMYVLIGGDIRFHVVDAMQYLVGRIKDECVTEKELYT